EALVVYNYMVLYDVFEHKLKDLFVKKVKAIKYDKENSSKIERLYFYLGCVGMLSNYIEYDTYSTVSKHNKFGGSDMINQFTLVQMVRIDEQEKLIECFKFNINSINNPKLLQYSFHDCCKKLTNMRNLLAHNFSNLKANAQNAIEILSDDKISALKSRWLENFDVKNMNDKSKLIFSNYIYMAEILEKLEKVDT
ncbi:MAG: hypothetical protein NC489_46365, partial [Ruminococcus flavefaciens]|nr:hypothetical protein [Ruminococcus flavefaciens]